jgi:hypothetical protein
VNALRIGCPITYWPTGLLPVNLSVVDLTLRLQVPKAPIIAISDEVDIFELTMVVNNLNPVRNWLKREYPRPDINPVRTKYPRHSHE